MTTDGYFFSLCGLCVLTGIFLGLFVACIAPDKTPAAAPAMYDPQWYRVVPPRSGLRCWQAGGSRGVAYCEPDPTATFGASP